jgi:hypothetical protein
VWNFGLDAAFGWLGGGSWACLTSWRHFEQNGLILAENSAFFTTVFFTWKC